ncbi:MAG TPA: hypothetical protein VGE21_17090 [Flavobacteriales bacterium]
MDTLSWSGPDKDRLVHMAFDEELDRYRVLAYLQRVDGRYREHKLYPHLDELQQRLQQLLALREEQVRLRDALPKRLIGFDPEGNSPLYAPLVDDGLWSNVEAMLDFSMPGIKRMLDLGRELRDELCARIRFAPVGVLPLSTQEGYILLCQGREASVYAYAVPLYHGTPALLRYRSVRTHYVTTCTLGPGRSYERIKAELVKAHRQLPNPATFVFETDVTLPRVETFMPLAKQLVYELIAPVSVPDVSLDRTRPV